MFTRNGDILLEDLNEMRIGIYSGLVNWYPFREAGARDRALGPANNGVLTGTTLITGTKPSVGAVQFNGGHISMTQAITSGDFTISTWLKSDGAQVPYATPLSQGHDRINKTGMAFTGSNFYIGNGTNGQLILTFPIDFESDLTWNKFEIKRSGLDFTAHFNDVQCDSGTADAVDLGVFGLTLGKDTHADKPFNGAIQDVRIYDRAISATESSRNFVLFREDEDNRALISADRTLYLAGEFTETTIIS